MLMTMLRTQIFETFNVANCPGISPGYGPGKYSFPDNNAKGS